jgi:hypothetical protein
MAIAMESIMYRYMTIVIEFIVSILYWAMTIKSKSVLCQSMTIIREGIIIYQCLTKTNITKSVLVLSTSMESMPWQVHQSITVITETILHRSMTIIIKLILYQPMTHITESVLPVHENLFRVHVIETKTVVVFPKNR